MDLGRNATRISNARTSQRWAAGGPQRNSVEQTATEPVIAYHLTQSGETSMFHDLSGVASTANAALVDWNAQLIRTGVANNQCPELAQRCRLSGVGFGTITLTPQPGTQPGAIATLNVDTDPPGGTPELESGPLVVTVRAVMAQ